MKVAVLTDTHLNHLNQADRVDFYLTLKKEIERNDIEAIVLTGDISEGHLVLSHLQEMLAVTNTKIYFVYGNHDYYKKTFALLESETRGVCDVNPNLVYLPFAGNLVSESGKSAIIGDDGWYDAGEGDFFRSVLVPKGMPDFSQITDYLMCVTKDEILGVIDRKANKALADLAPKIMDACIDPKVENIYLFFHVPIFKENSRYKGVISNDHYIPFFCNKRLGQFVSWYAEEYPHKQFIVHCGHTHEAHSYSPLSNLHCFTLGAEYASPKIGKILTIP